jgi:glutamyl-tRNA synthetase
MLRFSPSPTGDMHIDTLRVAIVNYLTAKQQNMPFLVRIDDTDKERVIEGKDTEFMQILEKFSLIHNTVFHQSEHLRMHQTLAIRLLQEGKAFVCTCKGQETPYSGCCIEMDSSKYAKLKESGEPFVIRLKKPQKSLCIHDIIQGDICASPDEIDSLVILNTDSTPTRNFASACDDMLNGINVVITDEESIPETLKQLHIKQMLGFEEETRYAHLPMIRRESQGISLRQLFEEGFIPDAIINYLLLLGYEDAPGKIFTLPDAIEWFSLENISKSAVSFDIGKLKAINREHLKMMDDKRLSSLFGFADADIGKLAKIYLEEASTVNELEAKVRLIFSPKKFEGRWEATMRRLQQALIDAPMFDTFDALQAYVIQETGLEKKDLSLPLRLLLTGTEDGPALSKIYPYIRSYLLEVIS